MSKQRALSIVTAIAFAAFAVAAVAIPFIIYKAHFPGPFAESDDAWAKFGDYMGGVAGPVLSFLALIALLYTIHLQTRDLRLTRDELERSSDALESQRSSMEKQLFDSAFYAQLRLLNEIVGTMDIEGKGGKTEKGRDCFVEARRRLEAAYTGRRNQQGNAVSHLSVHDSVELYMQVYRRYEADLGHYFRTVYNIVRFLDESPDTATIVHLRLLRAQLSDPELFLLFYNGLGTFGAPFKGL